MSSSSNREKYAKQEEEEGELELEVEDKELPLAVFHNNSQERGSLSYLIHLTCRQPVSDILHRFDPIQSIGNYFVLGKPHSPCAKLLVMKTFLKTPHTIDILVYEYTPENSDRSMVRDEHGRWYTPLGDHPRYLAAFYEQDPHLQEFVSKLSVSSITRTFAHHTWARFVTGHGSHRYPVYQWNHEVFPRWEPIPDPSGQSDLAPGDYIWKNRGSKCLVNRFDSLYNESCACETCETVDTHEFCREMFLTRLHNGGEDTPYSCCPFLNECLCTCDTCLKFPSHTTFCGTDKDKSTRLCFRGWKKQVSETKRLRDLLPISFTASRKSTETMHSTKTKKQKR